MMTPAGKRRIAAAQRARWARVRAERDSAPTTNHHSFMKLTLDKVDEEIADGKKKVAMAEKIRTVIAKLAKIA